MWKHRNKKKGSSLIVLLAIAMVITIVGGSIIASISYTMKNNNVSKEKDDLLYAAESGIEYGISYIEKNGITAEINTSPGKNISQLRHGIVDTVSIYATMKSSDTYTLSSLAKSIDGTSTKKVDIDLLYTPFTYPPLGGDIFKNGIVATESIEMQIDGSYDLGDTRVTYGNNMLISKIEPPNPSIVQIPVADENKNNITIDAPIFNGKIQNKPTITVKSISGAGETLQGKAVDLNAGAINVPNGVGKLSVNKSAGHTVEMYLVNANKLIIDLADNSTPLDETRKVIICSGDIEINTKDKLINKFTNGTIFGKNVTIDTPGAMHITGSPFYTDNDSNNELDTDAIARANDIIDNYISNWGGSIIPPGGGGGAGSGIWTIINGSYKYS